MINDMTPKAKANELLTRYFTNAVGYGPIERERAKRNAGLCVDEIINNVLVGIDLAATWGDYWVKVKQELEKL